MYCRVYLSSFTLLIVGANNAGRGCYEVKSLVIT